MKKIINSIIILVCGLLTPRLAQAQGLVYLSNLGQTPTNSIPVASDLWMAESFVTGTNAGGYALNYIQLEMTNASGNPYGFALMLYSAIHVEAFPGSSLDIFSGTANPTNSIYTYTPASNVTLLPRTAYFLVLTAGTTVANGAYEWNLGNGNYNVQNYNPQGGWSAPAAAAATDIYTSANGLNWTLTYFINPQFAINATAIPEPGVLGLFVVGALGFLWHRRRT